MSSELYEALLAAGVPEDKARAAATAALSFEDRFDRIDDRFGRIDDRFDRVEDRFDRIERQLVAHEGRFTLLQWMLAFNLAISVGVLFKVFSG